MNAASQPIQRQTHKQPKTPAQLNPFIEVTDSVRALASCVVAISLCVVWYIGLTSNTGAPWQKLRLIAATAYILISTAPLYRIWKSIGLLHPLYVISAYAFLKGTLPGLSTLAEGIDRHIALSGMSASDIAYLHVQVLALRSLTWLCIFAGFHYAHGIDWRFLSIRERDNVLATGSLIGLAIGLTCLILLVDLSGGISEHLKNITRGMANKVWVKDASMASTYASLVPMTVLAPAIWIFRREDAFANPIFWTTALCSVSSAFLINGRRSAILMIVLVLVACWILRRKSLAIGRLTIIGLLVFLSVGILGEFRRSNWNSRQLDVNAFTEHTVDDAFAMSLNELGSRRDGGAIYPIVAWVPERVPFKFGLNYLKYSFRFIPRIVWPDKPRGIGIECAEVFYGRRNTGGIPPGGVGEAYWTGGVVGVVLVYSFWGVILKSIGNFFLRFRHTATGSLIYLATITKLGPSEPQFRAWLYMTGPIVIVLWFLGIIGRAPLRTSPSPPLRKAAAS